MPEPEHNATELSVTEEFSQVLIQLAEYEKYFTDNTKNQKLVDYVSEEFGVSKVTARMGVKYIAPFVIGKLLAVGETVGKSWLRKLHDNLSDYAGYLSFTVKLLNILKTGTENNYESTLKNRSNHDLEKLVNNKARWENLKSEQQAVVQLLLGQNKLIDGQNFLQRQIDNLITSLEFDLDLDSPDYVEGILNETPLGSAVWLNYNRKQSDLIGREDALAELQEFIDQEGYFSWWLLTGAGGIGKSRLALEFMIDQPIMWQVGFLPKRKLESPDALKNWKPSSPTLIVVDCASEKASVIADWLEHLTKHANEYLFPVRLLLLERMYREEQWWEEILAPKLRDNNYRQNTLYMSQPYELRTLTFGEQKIALISYLDALGCKTPLPVNDDYFWVTLDQLSSNGYPLFVGMAAIAISKGGLHQVRNWEQDNLLDYIYINERSVWLRQIESEGLTGSKDSILTLLALSTVTNGFAGNLFASDIYEASDSLKLFKSNVQLEKGLEMLPSLTGNDSGCLQPDIFAEYAVLNHWQNKSGVLSVSAQEQLLWAYALSEQETLSFTRRAATDFPENRTLYNIWSFLRTKVDKATLSEELEFTGLKAYASLSTKGKFDVAQKLWLEPLAHSAHREIQEHAIVTLATNEATIRMLSGLNCALQVLDEGPEISKLDEKHIRQYSYIFSVAKLLGNTRVLKELDCLAQKLGLHEGWESLASDTNKQSLQDIHNKQGGAKIIPTKAFTDKDLEMIGMMTQLSYLSDSDTNNSSQFNSHDVPSE